MGAVIGPLKAIYANGSGTLAPVVQHIAFAPGETETIRAIVTASSGARVDVTGASLVLTVRSRAGVELLAREATLDVPERGEVSFPFTVDDTDDWTPGVYYYDVWILWDNGNHNQLIPWSTLRLLKTAYR